MAGGFIHITVEGLDEMIAKLNEITGGLGDQAVTNSVEEIGSFMADQMRLNAHVITGNMKNSIQSSVQGKEGIVECTANYAVYENARVGPAKTNAGPHDFVDRAILATSQRAEQMIRDQFDRLFSI